MHQPDWMTPEWLEGQKRKLFAEGERLRDSLEKETDLLGTTGTTSPRQPGDLAQEDREDIETAGTMDATRSSLRTVEDALARIDGGAYGRCPECGSRIARDRLEALPAALRCRPCQEAFEKRNALPLNA
jgi:DnaK suppressor protein